MKVTISDPSEPATSGYVSIRAENDRGELIADVDLAPEVVDDISEAYLELATDPDVLRGFADLLEGDGDDWGPPDDSDMGDLFG